MKIEPILFVILFDIINSEYKKKLYSFLVYKILKMSTIFLINLVNDLNNRDMIWDKKFILRVGI